MTNDATTVWESAQQQLADSLEARMEALVDLMVFLDVEDEALAAGERLAAAAGQLATLIIKRLSALDDPNPDPQEVDLDRGEIELDEDADALLAATAAEDLVMALWPDSQPPAWFWPSPLGLLIARYYGPNGSEGVPVVVAAGMMRVTRGRIYQLIDAGKLERHPDGVTRASVIARSYERSLMPPGSER